MSHNEDMQLAATLAASLAVLMPDWHVQEVTDADRNRAEETGDQHSIFWKQSRLVHRTEPLVIWLKFGGYQNEGRILIGGDLTLKSYHGSPFRASSRECDAVRITCTQSKSVAQIKSDIERRLMPDLMVLLGRIKPQYDDHMAFYRNRDATLARVAKALRTTVRTPHGSNDPVLDLGGGTLQHDCVSDKAVRLKVELTADQWERLAPRLLEVIN